MKIKYKFVDGKICEVDINDELGLYINAIDRKEENYDRKTRYHCPVSLDALAYEGESFVDDTYSPEKKVLFAEGEKKVKEFLRSLTEKQRQRVVKLLDGKSIKEIADEEGVSYLTIWDSMQLIKTKARTYFKIKDN